MLLLINLFGDEPLNALSLNAAGSKLLKVSITFTFLYPPFTFLAGVKIISGYREASSDSFQICCLSS